ncbi:hypothetical protein [Frankia sp. AiPa1]|uniref:hypothetical protein n=1 Tax=Frankia sp. AiPa1 TaxID=573492 RepID=UPI00202AE6A7|nr:hypothetical protein [Frankia sp. AiPa1]MCL9759103.1 hypothetical protein [Frankia sp. AiPa1]
MQSNGGGDVTFLEQKEPIDEYGRALYAVARSIVRAQLDQLTSDDLTDLNCDRADVTMRQLAKVARLDRDKGMRGDGFEWAVHEAISGGEPLTSEIVATALGKASPRLFKGMDRPSSVLFGYERAKYLGFLEAVVNNAGDQAVLLPDGSGRPYTFGPWVKVAAKGKIAEDLLGPRIRQVWKTDIFLSDDHTLKYAAATIKSNWKLLEAGRGLRVGIVPEAPGCPPGVRFDRKLGLWLAVFPDPNGFMGLFNDCYWAVAAAVCTLGKHERPPYYMKPSAKAQRLQEQLEKYPTARVQDIEAALNDAAQQHLIGVSHRLVSVEAPAWLHINEQRTPVTAPKPSFERLD